MTRNTRDMIRNRARACHSKVEIRLTGDIKADMGSIHCRGSNTPPCWLTCGNKIVKLLHSLLPPLTISTTSFIVNILLDLSSILGSIFAFPLLPPQLLVCEGPELVKYEVARPALCDHGWWGGHSLYKFSSRSNHCLSELSKAGELLGKVVLDHLVVIFLLPQLVQVLDDL